MKKSYFLLLPVALFLGALAHAQNINTVAGDGIAGFAGDGMAATNAKLDTIGLIAVDDSENIYIADAQNNRIRKVYKSTGIIATIAGTGTAGWTGDYGLAVNADIYYPEGIALDAAGNVYFTDNGNGIVRRITKATGVIHTIAGNGNTGNTGNDSAATNATFTDPLGIAVDDSGNVYISDPVSNCIRKVRAADSNIYLYAGNGTAGFSGDGSSAIAAQLNQPQGISVDRSGNLFIADLQNDVIREVNSSGIINTVAGIPGNNTATVANGTATTIPISAPTDVACDIYGNIFISDVNTEVIRLVNLSQNYEVVFVGDGNAGSSGDGGLALNAELNYPIAVCIDTLSNTFIGDLLNFRIRVTGKFTAVPSVSDAGNFQVYPDPVINTLTISFPPTYYSWGLNTFEIMDVSGRTVMSFDKNTAPNSTMQVDVSNFAAGMYFIKITNNTSSQVVKFVKQ